MARHPIFGRNKFGPATAGIASKRMFATRPNKLIFRGGMAKCYAKLVQGKTESQISADKFYLLRPVSNPNPHLPSLRWLQSKLSFVMAGGAIKGEAWSPAGGWFFIPKNANRNFAVVATGLVAFTAATWFLGSKLQFLSNEQEPDSTIDRWNSAARKARQDSAVRSAGSS